jgi:hypothetical protein
MLNPKWRLISHSEHFSPLIFSGWKLIEVEENMSMLKCTVCSRNIAPWNFLLDEESSIVADIPLFSPSKRVLREDSKDVEESVSKKPRIANNQIFEIGTLVKPVICFNEGLTSMDFCELPSEESKSANNKEFEEELSLEELRCLSRMKKSTSSKPEFNPLKEHRSWCPWRNCDFSKLLLTFCSTEVPQENQVRESTEKENGIELAKKTLSLVRSTLWSIPKIKQQFHSE